MNNKCIRSFLLILTAYLFNPTIGQSIKTKAFVAQFDYSGRMLRMYIDTNEFTAGIKLKEHSDTIFLIVVLDSSSLFNGEKKMNKRNIHKYKYAFNDSLLFLSSGIEQNFVLDRNNTTASSFLGTTMIISNIQSSLRTKGKSKPNVSAFDIQVSVYDSSGLVSDTIFGQEFNDYALDVIYTSNGYFYVAGLVSHDVSSKNMKIKIDTMFAAIDP